MMRYTVVKSVVDVLGDIWQPGAVCGLTIVLRPYDVENICERGDGQITRESVQAWLDCNAGDFSRVIDFRADIAVGGADVVIPWAVEDNEIAFADCIVVGGIA